MTGKIYPEGADWDALALRYVACFSDLDEMENRWASYKRSHPILYRFHYTVEGLMKASFDTLVGVYEQFLALPNTTDAEKKELRTIKSYLKYKVFNYDCKKKGGKYHQPDISNFFQKEMDGLNVHTCYYCDMAYINPFVDGAGTRSQFDLDHALGKAECPLVALSLHTFVPSCTVCNQRLKGRQPLSRIPDGIKLVAPCSEQFDGDKHIHFCVEHKKASSGGYMRHKDYYQIGIKATGDYLEYTKLFHLKERYEYHKGEALRLLDLKRNYPASHIRRMALMLHKTAEEVREDLFGLNYSKEHHRCFDKLKRDIL